MAMVLVLTVLIAASEFSSHPPTAECCDDQLSLPNTARRIIAGSCAAMVLSRR